MTAIRWATEPVIPALSILGRAPVDLTTARRQPVAGS
jgi:hypothetical protein